MASIFLPPSQTRLVTIAAHVDHGKTTLADSLIEHNGLLSERLAGTLRYLDSDPEEQRRGITMRSSAIGLQHQYVKQQGKQSSTDKAGQAFIIHLVDSPGHTDFSYEVSSALMACDACLLVVDAVEGMGPRTHQVFREALLNQHVPILVINKMDRLCTELCLSPTEAYVRIRGLLETINAAASGMITSAHHQRVEQNGGDNNKAADASMEEEEKLWTFDPAKGNVAFGSALFGWGFTVTSLAKSLFRSKAVSIKPMMLRPYLFGDYKLKGDKVLKWKASSSEEEVPIFAEYGLQPLWDIYEHVAAAAAQIGAGSSVFADGRHAYIEKTAAKLNAAGLVAVLEPLSIGAIGTRCPQNLDEVQQLLTHTGANTEETILRCLLRRFRPLATTILDAVCEYAPSPAASSSSVRSRVLRLQEPTKIDPDFAAIQESVRQCRADATAPVVAHVCKFFAAQRSQMRDPDLPGDPNQPYLLLGLTRVLSGCLRSDEAYYLLGPKHSEDSVPVQRVVRLYLLMGSALVRVDAVPAGHLCAISNLDDSSFKSVTLCDTMHGMPMQVPDRGVRPLVKVNVEAVHPADSDVLEGGLVKLSLADASVEVMATAKGERLLACLGELHLEQSILDLTKVYCSREIEVRISDPIIDFGETTDWFENETEYTAFFDDPSPPLRQVVIPPFNEEEGLVYARRGRMRSILSGRGAAISLRVLPLAQEVYQSLEEKEVKEGSAEELVKLCRALGFQKESPEEALSVLLEHLCSLGTNGNGLLESAGVKNGSCVRGVHSTNGQIFVPPTEKAKQAASEAEDQGDSAHQEGTSAVEAGFAEYKNLQTQLRSGWAEDVAAEPSEIDKEALEIWRKNLEGSVEAGFQMAIRAGPCCEEPVRNVLIVLEGIEIAVAEEGDKYTPTKTLSSGMIVSALRSGVRCALLTRPIRLMEGYLKLTLNASLHVLGALYPVLSKRRGKVLDDSMVEGTDLLLITALIPQAEAFGLAPELFGKTSGEVTAPEMILSHWQKLDVDPFWIPTTEEEREDYGELQVAGDSSTGMDNTAIKYIRQVRNRKGLASDSARTVVAAEKQRTLKR
jgi:ribosome assembly protein 1